MTGSFADVVLLRFKCGRTYAPDLLDFVESRSPTCEMLSSGLTSESTTVGVLCRRLELDGFECLLSERACPSRDSSAMDSKFGGRPPLYTYSSARRRSR